MKTQNIGSAGGKATSIKLRNNALKQYYNNPIKCKYCDEIIKVQTQHSVSETKLKQFCDRSCAASFNNKIPKRKKEIKKCKICHKKTPTNKSLYCKKCKKVLFTNQKITSANKIGDMTKGELFKLKSNWQNARTVIRKHAACIFEINKMKKICLVCGYSNHIEICHKKSVASFCQESKIKEINCISNLVALCPNHHWEYDNGLISLNAEVGFAPTKDCSESL